MNNSSGLLSVCRVRYTKVIPIAILRREGSFRGTCAPDFVDGLAPGEASSARIPQKLIHIKSSLGA